MTGDTIEQCVAEPIGGDGLIDPSQFPCKAADLDTSTITGSASDLRGMGTDVETEMTSISTSWSGMSAHYEAPEQEQVYSVMDPAVTSADELKTALHSAAGHLDTYASELSGLKGTLQDFETRAQAFRDRVSGGVMVDASEAADAGFGDQAKGLVDWVPGVDEEQVSVPWYEDSGTVEENEELLAEYAGLLEQISSAAATCANAINGLVTGMCVAEVEVIPAEAFTDPGTPMPWGYPRDEDRNCTESVGHGVSNFGYGIYSGAASLIGYDTEADDWGWDVAGQAWGGLGNFLGSTVVLMTGLPHLALLGAPMPDGARDWLTDRGDVAAGGWSSLVGYDYNEMLAGGDGWHRWQEDGVAAGTEAVLNVGTFFIPGAGQVGAALKTGTMGARVARIAGVVSDFVVPGGSFLTRGGISAVTGLRNAVRLGDDVPTGVGGTGPRFNPAGLIGEVTDLPTPPVDRTPVSDGLFGGNDGVPATPDVVPDRTTPGGDAGGHQPGGTQTGGSTPGDANQPGGTQPGGNQPGTATGEPSPAGGTSPGEPSPTGGTTPGSTEPPAGASPDPAVSDGTGATPDGANGGGTPDGGQTAPDGGPTHDRHGRPYEFTDDGQRTLPGDPPDTFRGPDGSLHSSDTGRFVTDTNIPDTPDVTLAERGESSQQQLDPSDGLVQARGEAQAAADASSATLADLAEQHGLDVGELRRSDPDVRQYVLDRVTDGDIDRATARDLVEASQDYRVAASGLRDASEQLGDHAAETVSAGRGETPLIGASGAGAGRFDHVAVGGDPPQLTFYEAKGGSSPLGFRTVDGVRVQQGTAPYLADVARTDPRLVESVRDYVRSPDADPAVVQALQDGTIEVHYDVVRARPDGTVVVERFVLDPAQVDVASWLADRLQR